MYRFNLDEIKDKYDLREVYPVSSKRRTYGHYSSDVCIFHGDAHPSMLIGPRWYKCRACEAKGDIFAWYMLANPGSTFTDACEALQNGTAGLTVVASPVNVMRAPPPVYRDEADEFVAGMSDLDYVHLQEKTGICADMARLHRIGRYDHGVYTIPIEHPLTREVVDLKLYRPGASKERGEIKTWHLKDGAVNQLYGVPYLNGDDYAVIFGGEKDTILGHQWHLPTVTNTSGEAAWEVSFNRLLTERRRVYVFLDADSTGRLGTQRLRKMFPRVIPCDWRTLWRPDVKRGYDFADFVAEGGTREEFLQMLQNAARGVYLPIGVRPPPAKEVVSYPEDEIIFAPQEANGV